MSDLLVELNTKPWFRQVVKNLGLPLPSPQKLRRPKGPRVERPLADRDVLVHVTGDLEASLAASLPRAGANPILLGADVPSQPWVDAGEAFGRPARCVALGDAPDGTKADAIVVDATGLDTPAALQRLHAVFQPWMRRITRNGRAIIIGRPPAAESQVGRAAAQAGLEGFVRSLAKELGRLGATAHVVYVAPGAEDRLDPLLRFLTSPRAAFLTGQPWHLGTQVRWPADVQPVRAMEGKIALVTGAARGIGKATARCLAAEGAHVICLDRPGDEGPASAIAREIGGTLLSVDITAEDAGQQIIAALEPLGGTLDALVHNAGITRDKTLAKMKPEWWAQAVAVNLGGVVAIDRALLDAGALANDARMVMLSSVAGLAGNFGQTNYSTAKAGLVGYVQALSRAVAEHGIAVNAVAPGFIETRLTAAMPPVNREVGRRMSALGQGGLPVDVAELISFLVTPGAGGLTGQTFRACGGMYIGA